MENDKWLTSNQVMDRLGINKVTLANHVLDETLKAYGLTPSKWGLRHLSSPIRLESRIIAPFWDLNLLVENLDDMIFRPEHVSEFEKKNGFLQKPEQANRTLQETPDKRIEPKKEVILRKKEELRENYFTFSGGYWKIHFQNKDCPPFKDSPGLKYIDYLLARPNTMVEASLLVMLGGDPNPDSSDPERFFELSKKSLNGSLYQKVIGEQEKSRDESFCFSIQSELKEIETQINQTNDSEKKQKLEEKLKLFQDELRQSKGEKGSDNARSAVTMAINRTITQIEKHHPSLAKYLKQTIKTGVTCHYHPLVEKPIHWSF
jgi:hypothetical protein